MSMGPTNQDYGSGIAPDVAAIEVIVSNLPDNGQLLDLATIEAVTSVLPDAGALTSISDETDKVDGAATDGLLGVSNSLSYRVEEVEKHFHSAEHWYGKDPGDTFLLEGGLTPWVLIAGAGEAYGAWVQLSNGDEVVNPKYDPGSLLVVATSTPNATYLIQLGTGAGGAQVVKTTMPMVAVSTARFASIDFPCPRIANTDNLWARCKATTNGATISILLGLHSYVG